MDSMRATISFKRLISVILPQITPTLTTLNQNDLGNESSKDEQLNEHNVGNDINDPDKVSLNSFKTVLYNVPNIAPKGYSTKISGHTTIKAPEPSQMTYCDSSED